MSASVDLAGSSLLRAVGATGYAAYLHALLALTTDRDVERAITADLVRLAVLVAGHADLEPASALPLQDGALGQQAGHS